LIFGGWDIRPIDLFEATMKNQVIPESIAEKLKSRLQSVKIMPGTIWGAGPKIVQLTKLEQNPHNITGTCREIINKLSSDISQFRLVNNLTKVVVVNTMSVDQKISLTKIHNEIDEFERALDNNSPSISSGMLYAYAAIISNCSYINFTPEITIEIPALASIAKQNEIVYAGKDGKTGQTLYKSFIASMLKIRQLKLDGWFSLNLLGNKDGFVLADPLHSEAKIASKRNILPQILGYDDFVHEIRIEYYPPRGDAKEAWDNIDFEGWMNQKMSMKIIWEGRDSILAAPLIVDLVRLVVLGIDKGERGVLKELALFFKMPYGNVSLDIYDQYELLVTLLSKFSASN